MRSLVTRALDNNTPMRKHLPPLPARSRSLSVKLMHTGHVTCGRRLMQHAKASRLSPSNSHRLTADGHIFWLSSFKKRVNRLATQSAGGLSCINEQHACMYVPARMPTDAHTLFPPEGRCPHDVWLIGGGTVHWEDTPFGDLTHYF